MLTNLKIPSLACKCVFYRPVHNASGNTMELTFEGFEMQKSNISTDRDQRADKKKGVICLVIMFIPEVMVIKILKMTRFCIIC